MSAGTKNDRAAPRVAVIAHSGKSFGGGLPELRAVLTSRGITDPFWAEVPKSRKAPAQIRRALDAGADLIFVWGGDGMVQRSVDMLAGTQAQLAVLPAGTANLFASNLAIPKDISEAVDIGLRRVVRRLDVGRFPERQRKLLLHRAEIDKLNSRINQEKLTLVPLEMYFKDGRIKVRLGLGKGQTKSDKRNVMAKRDADEEIRREMGRRRKGMS